jgi:hypothetical protein
VCPDRRWVSFMWSYPNLIPLGPAAVREVVNRLRPFAFDRLYGAFPDQVVGSDAKGAVERSADRYLKMVRRCAKITCPFGAVSSAGGFHSSTRRGIDGA